MTFGRKSAIDGETVNIEGVPFPRDLVQSLCEANGFDRVVHIPDRPVEQALHQRQLIKRLVRGGAFGTDKLRALRATREQVGKMLASTSVTSRRTSNKSSGQRSSKNTDRRLATLLGMYVEAISADRPWYVLRDRCGQALGCGGPTVEDAWLDCPRFSRDFDAAFVALCYMSALGWRNSQQMTACADGTIHYTICFEKEGVDAYSASCDEVSSIPSTITLAACQALDNKPPKSSKR